MSDFDGKRLVFRDKIERQFWGAAYAADRGVVAPTASMAADKAVIEMRIRQKEILHHEGTGARLCCAVCLNPLINEGEPAPHVNGCPLGPPW